MSWTCSHRLAVDEDSPRLPGGTVRRCLTCGEAYERGSLLRRVVLDRHRLPPSPWTASERSEDAW